VCLEISYEKFSFSWWYTKESRIYFIDKGLVFFLSIGAYICNWQIDWSCTFILKMQTSGTLYTNCMTTGGVWISLIFLCIFTWIVSKIEELLPAIQVYSSRAQCLLVGKTPTISKQWNLYASSIISKFFSIKVRKLKGPINHKWWFPWLRDFISSSIILILCCFHLSFQTCCYTILKLPQVVASGKCSYFLKESLKVNLGHCLFWADKRLSLHSIYCFFTHHGIFFGIILPPISHQSFFLQDYIWLPQLKLVRG